MGIFTIFTVLIVLSAIFGFLNIRFLKMPNTIGMMLISICFTALLSILGRFYQPLDAIGKEFIGQIDFSEILLDVMLSFLLFAGSLHTKWAKLKAQRLSILLLSTLGVLMSTFLIGTAFYYLVLLFGLQIDFIFALIFGALISPTDPIAVLGILKEAKAPEKLEVTIVGESLFNDGVGVVVFLSLVHISQSAGQAIDFGDIGLLFIQEVFGGILLGGVFGYFAFLMLRAINHYETEIIITIALVTATYLVAKYLHTSGPLAVVVAGLFIGTQARKTAFSKETERYLDKFWELLDVILNAILFVLIGLEMMVLEVNFIYALLGLASVVMTLIARYLVLSLPVKVFKRKLDLVPRTALLMTWGGLRGGISIALALSLAQGETRDMILVVSYIVVVFSIAVQGLTLKSLIKRVIK